jgi:hypothetical protein
MSIRQTVFQDHSSHLPHLIRPRMAAVLLKIDSFLDSGFAKHMVAAADAGLESQSRQQRAQLVKSNAGICGAAQVPIEGPFRTHGAIVPRYLDWKEQQ